MINSRHHYRISRSYFNFRWNAMRGSIASTLPRFIASFTLHLFHRKFRVSFHMWKTYRFATFSLMKFSFQFWNWSLFTYETNWLTFHTWNELVHMRNRSGRSMYFTYEVLHSCMKIIFTYEIFISHMELKQHVKCYFHMWNCIWNFCKPWLTMLISVRDRFQLGGWGLLPENFFRHLNSQNEPTTKPCLQQNCAYYIFYAIVKWHRNGYKQSNINGQYVQSKIAELFLSDPRLWEDKNFCPKNGNVTQRNWRCPNLRGAAVPRLTQNSKACCCFNPS